jgi:hypothetical protein
MIHRLLFADPKTIIAALALIVSLISLAISWLSGNRASRALAISEEQENRRKPRFTVYVNKSRRRLTPHGQRFDFLLSVSNPTDTSNSIARAELQITYLLENDVKAVYRIQHDSDLSGQLDSAEELRPFALPVRIEAHQTLSGWFLFSLDDVIKGTVDSHSIILEDTHSISTDSGSIMVREWTHETQKG